MVELVVDFNSDNVYELIESIGLQDKFTMKKSDNPKEVCLVLNSKSISLSKEDIKYFTQLADLIISTWKDENISISGDVYNPLIKGYLIRVTII